MPNHDVKFVSVLSIQNWNRSSHLAAIIADVLIVYKRLDIFILLQFFKKKIECESLRGFFLLLQRVEEKVEYLHIHTYVDEEQVALA